MAKRSRGCTDLPGRPIKGGAAAPLPAAVPSVKEQHRGADAHDQRCSDAAANICTESVSRGHHSCGTARLIGTRARRRRGG